MTTIQDSARSRVARRAAQDLLRKFREERRSRARRGAPVEHDSAAANESANAPMFDEAAQEETAAELRPSARAEALARSAADLVMEAGETVSTVVEHLEAPASASDDVAIAEAVPNEEPDDEPVEESVDAESAPCLGSEETDADADLRVGDPASDLAKLPGIGPGLIWVLEQAGITEMTALASADPEQLRAHLGVIGELVDVDAWIELAKERAG